MSELDKIWNRKFSLMVASNFMTSVAFYFMITALPVHLTADLMFGKDQTGLIIAAYIFTAVLIRPFVGFFIDRYGRRTIYLSALFLFSSLFVLYGLATSLVAFIAIRIAHGFLWGILTAAGNTIILDFVPSSKRGQGIGYYGLAFTLSMAVGPLLASLIIQQTSYLVLFVLASSVAFMGTCLLLSLRFPKHIPSKTSILDSLKGFISPSAIPIAILTIVILMPYGAVLNFITIYCKNVNTGTSALFFLSLAFGLTISRLFAGKEFDKNGPFRLLIISYVLVFCAFPVLIAFDSSITLSISALMIGMAFGISFPVYQLMLNNVLPTSMRITANSLYLTAIDVGIGIGVVIMGYFTEYADIKLAFGLCGVFGIVGLLYYLFYVDKHYQKSVI
jgi:predicted MFS family arabinose efflux permease